MLAVKRAIRLYSDLKNVEITLEDNVPEFISTACGGDVRKAINAVELLLSSAKREGENLLVTLDDAKLVAQRSSSRYDRDGDAHYDIMSAYHKSLRGSDPDAALHYLARLLEAGDLPSACRRLLAATSEDVGLAYPQAISIVKACVDLAMQLGLPEARLPLAEAVILVTTAPKSNSVVMAIDAAIADVKDGKPGDVPDHLKDTHYTGAKKLGRGLTYKYPHDFENNYVKQQYLPDNLKGRKYYNYGTNKAEEQAKAYWEKIKGTK